MEGCAHFREVAAHRGQVRANLRQTRAFLRRLSARGCKVSARLGSIQGSRLDVARVVVGLFRARLYDSTLGVAYVGQRVAHSGIGRTHCARRLHISTCAVACCEDFGTRLGSTGNPSRCVGNHCKVPVVRCEVGVAGCKGRGCSMRRMGRGIRARGNDLASSRGRESLRRDGEDRRNGDEGLWARPD